MRLVIFDKKTGEAPVNGIFNDSFIFEVILMYVNVEVSQNGTLFSHDHTVIVWNHDDNRTFVESARYTVRIKW